MFGNTIIKTTELHELKFELATIKKKLYESEQNASAIQFKLTLAELQLKNAMKRDPKTGRILKTK